MTCYQAEQHNIDPRILVVPHTHTNACAQEEAGSKGQQANEYLPAQHSHHALPPNMQWYAVECPENCDRRCCILRQVLHNEWTEPADELWHACQATAWLHLPQFT